MFDNYEFFLNSYNKNKKMSVLILAVISIFEISMMIYGGLTFDLSKLKNLGYFCSYIFLLAFSLLTLIVILATNKKVEKNAKLLRVVTVTYEFAIILWSIFVSSLDTTAGNYPIVFLTVIFVVPYIFVIHPAYLCIFSFLGTVCVCSVYCVCFPESMVSYLINMFIACSMNIIITIRAHYSLRKAYLYESSLLNMSYTDKLTQINNRRFFEDKLNRIEGNDCYTIVLLDLDDFELINSKYGRKKGDEVLIYTANTLKRLFGEESVYRFDGDEFAIICRLNLNMLIDKLTILNKNLKETYSGIPTIGISSGIYQITKEEKKRNYVLNADNSLNKAKITGKGKIVIYN